MGLNYRVPDFVPRRGLRNGHANTIYAYLRPRRPVLPPAASWWLPREPGVELLLECHWQPAPAPALLLLHGLEGSAGAGYMCTAAALAFARGWHAIRMNVRGCGLSEPRCATLYNSGMSDDVSVALDAVLHHPAVVGAALAGFSMGGNLALKYAGERGSDPPAALWAVAAVSPCLNLDACATALHRRANWLYERRFLRLLKRRLRRHAARFPGRYPVDALGALRSVRAFDDRITAPFTGYRDAADYYARASAANVLHRVAVPTLVLHAEDDPFIVIEPAARAAMRANPRICFHPTAHGGHCSFLRAGEGEAAYWAEATVVDFCAAMAPQPIAAGPASQLR